MSQPKPTPRTASGLNIDPRLPRLVLGLWVFTILVFVLGISRVAPVAPGESRKLVEWGFRAFEPRQIFAAGTGGWAGCPQRWQCIGGSVAIFAADLNGLGYFAMDVAIAVKQQVQSQRFEQRLAGAGMAHQIMQLGITG